MEIIVFIVTLLLGIIMAMSVGICSVLASTCAYKNERVIFTLISVIDFITGTFMIHDLFVNYLFKAIVV